MSVKHLPTMLNCVECKSFEEFEQAKENVVECLHCGKYHSNNSLYVIDPDKIPYERDEAGNLLVVPP